VWLLFFIAAKLLFLTYQHSESFSLKAAEWLSVILHGFRLDLSMASYVMLLPALLFASGIILRPPVIRKILNIYTFMILAVVLILTLADLEIYKYWGTRLDTTPLQYLKTPKEALASSSFLTIIFFCAAFALSFFLLMKLFLRLTRPLKDIPPLGFKGMFIFLLLGAFLVIPVRGGIGVSVINAGSAYFHQNPFANHAAMNVVWNFGHSVFEGKETNNRFAFYEGDGYRKVVEDLYESGDTTVKVLNTSKPDVLLIILESFSSKLIEVLGGEAGITPAFNKLAEEGVLFSSIYSTDSRTDKGLAAILSGYPVITSMPILSYPEKNANLPFLSSDLANNGYNVSFSYGGEIDFANMRSYLVNGKFGSIKSEDDYKTTQKKGKWGIHDDVMFDNFYSEVTAGESPFFKVLLTISNHEPFEIPAASKFGSSDLKEKYFSAAYYTDSCLGNFISRLKQTPAWNDLLIILISDHGARLPDYSEIYEARKYFIPMLWIGGAVKKDTVVSKYGSQSDLAVTLLRQMDISTENYVLGKDLLSPLSASFTFYSYKDGIGMLTDTSSFGLDLQTGSFSFSTGKVDGRSVETAKAFQQYMFQHYLDL